MDWQGPVVVLVTSLLAGGYLGYVSDILRFGGQQLANKEWHKITPLEKYGGTTMQQSNKERFHLCIKGLLRAVPTCVVTS